MNTGQTARDSAESPWFQRTADAANRGSPAGIAGKLTESQQAGLAAAIALAQADAAAVADPILPGYPADAVAASAEDWSVADEVGQRGEAEASPWLASVQTPLLMVILTIQAVLSLRLVWSNTAFLDEATYLLAGHAELAHWLHGTPVRASTPFPGAPVIYPPVAALAARLGGLAAARILSLLFMLGTTSLLWSMTRKLFGASAALCAAALFAVTGPTVQLGAFATVDAMALLLVAASAWCLVSARHRDDSAFLLIAGIVLLVLANATEYSTLIFDPPVIVIAGLATARRRGAKPAVGRSGYVAAGVIGLTGALVALAGPSYWAGIVAAIAGADGASAALTVLTGAWKGTGLLFAIAAAGVILSCLRRRDRTERNILAVLAAASALALLTQAGAATKISLSEHIAFGAWFAAAAGGYAISRLSRLSRLRPLHYALAGLLVTGAAVPVAITGRAQAWQMFHEWPNAAPVIASLRSVTDKHPGQYLAEDYDVPAYYLESTTSWQQWSGTWYFSYAPPGTDRALTGRAAYRAAINHHYFSVVVLDFETTPQLDASLTDDLDEAGDYQVIGVVHSSIGQYTIWAYEPPRQPARRS